MKFASTVLASLFVATSVSAHATWQEFWLGSTDEAGSNVRLPLNNNPVTDVSSTDIACNHTPSASPGKVTVPAGSTVTVEMHQQPGDRSCANEAIGGAHYGPIQIYLAKVDNALTAVGSDANWFKVSQVGLISTNPNYWGTQQLNDNCGKYTFTIPSCIPAGDYLLRAEALALHVASQLNGAQFYMSCYTITVTGGGSASPSTVKFPGAYKNTDPGILFDLYGTYSTYTIPGPPVFTCSGSGTPSSSQGGSSPSSSKPASSSTKPASSSTKPTSTSSTKTSSAAGAGQTLYGQCGGQGWTGPTTCASGTCKVSSQYYSQCLP